MPLNPRRAVSAGCVVAALALPLCAQAASSGVHVDPNSPAGKEYAIPLNAVRSQDGGSAPVRPTPAAAPTRPGTSVPAAPTSAATDSRLFGAGISPAPAAHRPAAHAKAPTRVAAPTPRLAVAAADRRGVGGSTAMFWIVAALALLIPGLAVGIGVRRWRHA